MAKKSFISLVDTGSQTGVRTLIEQTYALLREDILSGRLAPGEKLLIEHLKDRYEVGAGTLREALSRLVSEAMVSAEGQRGFTVAPITLEDLMDITNVRVQVETEALRTSIRHGDESWRRHLRAAYENLSVLEQPLLPENAQRWERANTGFHEALLAACDSHWTLRLVRQLTQHGERYRRYAIGLHSNREVHAEHALIFESAMAGQEARAALALEAHIRATPELIAQTIQSGHNLFMKS
ncbi:MAG: GntR family transcriptional regulator [Oxalobacteraceae bacterium]